MLAEAISRVSFAWVIVRLLPYKLWRRRLGVLSPLRASDEVAQPVKGEQQQLARDVAWAHGVIERSFGSLFTCLMLALSARDMLARRGLASTIILGVERHTRGNREKRMGAHAWVKLGDCYIVGKEGSERFTPVAAYCSGTA